MTTTSAAATDIAAGHAAVIVDIYEAFGTGDIPALLAPLAEDISWDGDWADHFAQRAELEMFTPRHGRAAAEAFFGYVAGCTIHDFQVLDVIAGERQVVVQVVIELSYPNGGRYRDEELHLWTFGADGKIIALRHYVDTAKHIAAAGGQDTTAG